MKIFDVEVSVYPNYTSPDKPKIITLNQWFESTRYRDKVLELRKYQDKVLRDQMKATLPAMTPSGTFRQRSKGGLIQHSGFIQFDIDKKDNPKMDPVTWKPEIMKLGCAVCQLSVSGQGLWGLFRILNPFKHEGHFLAMAEVFEYYKIKIDPSCKDVSRLRGYSWDDNTLFNDNAIVFKHWKQELNKAVYTIPERRSYKNGTTDNIEYCIKEIERKGIDITQNYHDWFALGCAIASEFGEKGRGYFHTISKNYHGYDPRETDRQYNYCLGGKGYTIATFFEYCKQNGIKYTEKKISVDNEIFCRMAKKNPSLLKLKDDFDLTDKYGNEFSCS